MGRLRLEMLPLLSLLFARSAESQAGCMDENPDCPNWAAQGECQANPSFMLQSCKKSCGKCRQPKPSAGGGRSSSRSSSQSSSTPAEKPASTAEILGHGSYSLHAGKIGGKGAALHMALLDLRSAKKWCDAKAECAGFHIPVQSPAPAPTGLAQVTFRRQAASIVDDVAFVTYVKGAGPDGKCEERAGDGVRAGCTAAAAYASSKPAGQSAGGAGGESSASSDKSSWHGQQVAAYYLRVAEIYSYSGSSKAQEVVDQVRAALLSGADRDSCYMLRAAAYLQLENVDNAKRDLSAILRSDPEHRSAKAMHRQLKKYAKALDQAEAFKAGRQWAEAVERYTAAQTSLSPPLEGVVMRGGMCTCLLRLRKEKDAVIWCEKAHNGNQDDLPTLYALVEAKALNGEEHAGLQLLKTAQRRFPRDRVLHDKIFQLEQKIKRQGKVNYYKVLGVARASSNREIKKAYHQLAKKYHPDKIDREEDKPAAEAMFKKVARAYEVLGDEDMRRRYDAGEDVDDPNAMNQRQQQQQNPFGGFGGFPGGAGGFPGGANFHQGGGGRRTHHFRYG